MNKKSNTYEFFKRALMQENNYTSETQITPEDDAWICQATEDYLELISEDNY